MSFRTLHRAISSPKWLRLESWHLPSRDQKHASHFEATRVSSRTSRENSHKTEGSFSLRKNSRLRSKLRSQPDPTPQSLGEQGVCHQRSGSTILPCRGAYRTTRTLGHGRRFSLPTRKNQTPSLSCRYANDAATICRLSC